MASALVGVVRTTHDPETQVPSTRQRSVREALTGLLKRR